MQSNIFVRLSIILEMPMHRLLLGFVSVRQVKELLAAVLMWRQ